MSALARPLSVRRGGEFCPPSQQCCWCVRRQVTEMLLASSHGAVPAAPQGGAREDTTHRDFGGASRDQQVRRAHNIYTLVSPHVQHALGLTSAVLLCWSMACLIEDRGLRRPRIHLTMLCDILARANHHEKATPYAQDVTGDGNPPFFPSGGRHGLRAGAAHCSRY